MVWVYSRPVKDKRLNKIRKYLAAKAGNTKTADRVVKALSLNDYIRQRKWENPSEIRTSVFHDSDRKHPIFSEQQSKLIFRMLKQSGGTSDEALVFDKGIRALMGYLRDNVPEPVTSTAEFVYPYVTLLKSAQENPTFGPMIEIAKEIAVQAGTTGIVATNTIAAEAGGPVGVAVVAIPAAIAGLMIVLTHVLEDELGEALLASFLILPFVGPILYKSAISTGKIANKISQSYPELMPFGGKRFSTQRRKDTKWLTKTRRTKSAHL
jgi:hypothetical protein